MDKTPFAARAAEEQRLDALLIAYHGEDRIFTADEQDHMRAFLGRLGAADEEPGPPAPAIPEDGDGACYPGFTPVQMLWFDCFMEAVRGAGGDLARTPPERVVAATDAIMRTALEHRHHADKVWSSAHGK